MEQYSEEIKYLPVVNNHSTLVYRTIQPQNSTSQTLNITSSVGPVEVIIPPSVWNPSKSRLNFNLTVPAQGVGRYIFTNANMLTTISRLVFYDSSTNAVLLDCGNFDKYACMVVPASTHIDSFLTKAFSTGQGSSTLATANSTPIEDIAKAPMNEALFDNLIGVSNNDVFNECPVISRRQQFIGGSNVSVNLNVSIPFEAFKHTFLSNNKAVYFPSNTVLQIYFNAGNQFSFTSADAGNAATTPLALTVAPTLSNISVSLANEGNLNLVSSIISKVMKEGMSLPIAYPTTTRQAFTTATSHAYSLQLTRGYGSRILAIITSPFSTENFNTNVHRRSSIIGNDIITSYQTFLNNVPNLTNAPFDCTRGQDYIIANKPYLEKSTVQTIGEYALCEWLHVDGFCGAKPLWQYDLDQNMLDGLDVGAQSSTWSILATTTSLTCNWITAIIGQKLLTITNQGAMVT